MAMLDPVPLPPELDAPDPAAEAWVESLMEWAVSVSVEADMTSAAVAADLADQPNGSDLHGLPAGVQHAAQWRPRNDRDAEWAMRHYVAAEAELADLRAKADEWAASIARWFTQRAEPQHARRAWAAVMLERYALARRAEDEKRNKTLVLPSGKVSTTAHQAKVVVADELAVKVWAENMLMPQEVEAVLQTTTKVMLGGLRDVVHVAQVLVEADLVMSPCGCTPREARAEGIELPPNGTAMLCPTCGEDALLGNSTPVAYQWLAMDGNHRLVPGVQVQLPEVSAKVVPT